VSVSGLRIAVIACCLAAPAVVCAVMLTALETYRLIDPAAPIFGGPPPASLAESIAKGFGVEQTYQFVRAGQDPNDAVSVDDPKYTGGTTLTVSPLMLSVAANDSAAVEMLLGFGASLDAPENRHIECLAREVGNREILDTLARHSRDASTATCPDRKREASTPLAAWSPGTP
jgi:hypothetical protein